MESPRNDHLVQKGMQIGRRAHNQGIGRKAVIDIF